MLAATLSTVGTIPVAPIMLIFGIDKFMSECRAVTNMVGNSVATLVVAKWEGVLDREQARAVLDGHVEVDAICALDNDVDRVRQPELVPLPA